MPPKLLKNMKTFDLRGNQSQTTSLLTEALVVTIGLFSLLDIVLPEPKSAKYILAVLGGAAISLSDAFTRKRAQNKAG